MQEQYFYLDIFISNRTKCHFCKQVEMPIGYWCSNKYEKEVLV